MLDLDSLLAAVGPGRLNKVSGVVTGYASTLLTKMLSVTVWEVKTNKKRKLSDGLFTEATDAEEPCVQTVESRRARSWPGCKRVMKPDAHWVGRAASCGGA